MHFKLPLRLSSKRFSRAKRPPSPPPTPPATSNMPVGKGQAVVIDLDDISDEEEVYGTPLTGSSYRESEARLVADEDAEDHQPLAFRDPEDLMAFDDDLTFERAAELPDPEQACLEKVLEVFPDIDHEHVRQLYQARPLVAEGGAFNGSPSEELILQILDGGVYPKEKERRNELKRKRAVSTGSSEGETAAWEAADRERASGQYSEEARNLLKEEFPSIPTRFVDQVFRQNGNLYPTYLALEREERIYHETKFPPYNRLKYPRKQKTSSSLAQVPGQQSGQVLSDLVKELEAARKKRRKEDTKRQLQKDEEDAEATNEREHRENGMMMECSCCYDEFPFNKATHCDGEEPHFFCLVCAKRNANNEIGNSKYKLRCMDSSGCKAEFAKEQIRRFLDQKTMETLERLQQQDEIRLADLDDLTSCPFCDFAAICAPVEEDREFRCANPECEKVSCRLCKHETHIPLSCAAYAKENKVTIRHAVEEAMTEALVRSCHKCKNKYIKEFGCNKMMCTRCSSIQCYVCSKDITKDGYTHFNESTRGGRPGQCPLFDNTEQRHDEDVKKAEQKALEKVRADNPGFSEEELKVKVSDAVEKNERERIRQATAAHGHYVPPRMPRRIPELAGRAAPYPVPPVPPVPGPADLDARLAAVLEHRRHIVAEAARRNRQMDEAARIPLHAAPGRVQLNQLIQDQARARARGQAQALDQARPVVQAQPPVIPQAQPFPAMAYPVQWHYEAPMYLPNQFGGPYQAAYPGYPPVAVGLPVQLPPAPPQVLMNQLWQVPDEGQRNRDIPNNPGHRLLD